MADAANYAALIPPPPEDLREWCKSKGFFGKEYLIFRCGYRGLVGQKERCFDVVCTACGAKFTAERLEDDKLELERACHWGRPPEYRMYRGRIGSGGAAGGWYTLENDRECRCPHCGAQTTAQHVSAIGGTG